MAKLISKIVAPENLNTAWRLLRSDKALWQVGVSRAQFERDMVFHILKLAYQLSSGEYMPDPMRFFPVKKMNGKNRIISALTLRDKLAQKAVLRIIEPFGENIFHPNSYGYRPGRSVDMAVAKVREYILCGYCWIVDADIKSCFDQIPQQKLKKAVKAVIPDRAITCLIDKWTATGAVSKKLFRQPRGIPQGAILSPFLCNVYLTTFDNDLSRRNIPFVRFADDFLAFATTQEDAQKTLSYIKKRLKALGLEVNARKTRVAHCSSKIVFLGKKLPDVDQDRISTKE